MEDSNLELEDNDLLYEDENQIWLRNPPVVIEWDDVED